MQKLVLDYILDKLNTFIIDNKIELLNKRIFEGYGFEICLGNNENYVFINYCRHIYTFNYNIAVGFGKRAFVKDKDLDYIAMKPHYTINDFNNNFNSKIVYDFEKDKKTIDEVCEIIPTVFTAVANQTDKCFFDKCSK